MPSFFIPRSLRTRSLIALILLSLAGAGWAQEDIFRHGDELIVRVPDLDLLRQSHSRLDATVRVIGAADERRFAVDLRSPLVSSAIVVDVTGFGKLRGVSLQVVNEGRQTVVDKKAAPVFELANNQTEPAAEYAAIERGSKLPAEDSPRVALLDAARYRLEKLSAASRTLTSASITYPVVAEADLPALSSANYVIVSRQSFAPDDATKCSLYFSYRKGIFDAETAKLTKYRKLLVEVPLDSAWLDGSGDRTITLPLDRFAIHTTNELERFGKRWNAPRGYAMLGESSTGLYQGGQTADIDELGRIYISNVPDGAGLIRFNPALKKFEQPPVNFHDECRKLLPSGDDWRRSWDTDLPQIVCARGRVFLVFDRNYRVLTPNGKFETCSGVVSVPQEHWDDTDKFRADIRLHAACWPTAQHALYTDDVAVGSPRRAGPPQETARGLAFGSFRLELDDQGYTSRLEKEVTDAPRGVAHHGLKKQQLINVGSAGRPLLEFRYGEFQTTRGALSLALPGDPARSLADASARPLLTVAGSPPGKLTVRFDITAKLLAEANRYGELSQSLTGAAQGPNYAVIAIPGEANRAIGVCEYSYYYSKLDFSRRATERKVFRSYLPQAGGSPNVPINVGLGPYNATWLEHDDALWLYIPGYTGISRLKYAERGRALHAFASESIHARLTPRPIDGQSRNSVKDFLHLLPSMDGRAINIGRGRPGRGGGAYSAGLELFDPSRLGESQTAVTMNRCFGLATPVSRIVFSTGTGAATSTAAGEATKPTTTKFATAKPRQEIFAASGLIRPEYVDDLDPAQRPADSSPKIFCYEVPGGGDLRDLFGFSLPKLPGGTLAAADIALSPCQQYLVALQDGGVLLSYHIASRRIVDAVTLRTPSDKPLRPLDFTRPGATLWTSPSQQMFFHAALEDESSSVTFFEVAISRAGRLGVRPHLTVTWEQESRVRDFERIVRCFLPDLTNHDGSYDLVLGGSQDNGGQSTVRVIEDFIKPRHHSRTP